ncbi:hypothetical protein JZU71_01520, partial [bacterium]|nr:hypothetical protein [bacterium]
NEGTEELLEAVIDCTPQNEETEFTIYYGEIIETAIYAVVSAMNSLTKIKYPLRWLAIKLLENDAGVTTALLHNEGGNT